MAPHQKPAVCLFPPTHTTVPAKSPTHELFCMPGTGSASLGKRTRTKTFEKINIYEKKREVTRLKNAYLCVNPENCLLVICSVRLRLFCYTGARLHTQLLRKVRSKTLLYILHATPETYSMPANLRTSKYTSAERLIPDSWALISCCAVTRAQHLGEKNAKRRR